MVIFSHRYLDIACVAGEIWFLKYMTVLNELISRIQLLFSQNQAIDPSAQRDQQEDDFPRRLRSTHHHGPRIHHRPTGQGGGVRHHSVAMETGQV